MPDETSTSPDSMDSTSSPQAADTPAPPTDSINSPQGEPVIPPASEPLQQSSGQATPPPEAAAPAPEPEQVSENLTGKPDTPTTPSAVADTRNEGNTTTPSASGGHPSQSERFILAGSTEEWRLKGDIAKARAAMQDRKQKKLEKIMAKILEKGEITNDEVEKLLHVSDATATRYLQVLEKENRIKQTGSTGMGVFYEKV